MEIIDCSNSEVVYYQVQQNDDLKHISKIFGTNITNIVRNNPNIDLYAGEVVKIVCKNNALHIVKPMETLNSIAQKYNVDVEQLIRQNGLTSKRLFIGQTLIVEQ